MTLRLLSTHRKDRNLYTAVVAIIIAVIILAVLGTNLVQCSKSGVHSTPFMLLFNLAIRYSYV